MPLFRGYIRVKGKKPLNKFKNVPLLSFDEVKDSQGYAGVLAKETVLIDIDNEEQAERLLKIIKAKNLSCQVRKTTRGMHFYFENNGKFEKCGTEKTLAIGLKADIKIGLKNSLANLKVDGVVREIIYDNPDFLSDDYEKIPFWMQVIRSKMELEGVAEGEGRNTKLFSYILPLQESGFSKEQIIEILGIINEFIFDKPLSKEEFESVTRDEAFKKALIPTFYDEDGRFLFEQFAHYMITIFKIKRINGGLHFFNGKIYESGDKKIEAKMISIMPKINARQRNEALKYIELLILMNEEVSPCNLIAFNNGIYDIETGELKEFSPDIVITNLIPWDYVKGAYDNTLDKTLNKIACNDRAIRALLEEAVGYCFYRRNELRKAFILTGEKSNGKSTFIAVVQKLLGAENWVSLDLKDVGDRFRGAEIFGKLANLGDDINDEFIRDVSQFKKLVSGETLTAERKGKDPFQFASYAKLIFSANNLPRTKDKTGAVLDRLIIIPFNATFSKNDSDFDPFIKDKLLSKSSLEYLINIGINGLKRVLNKNSFTECEAVIKELNEYNRMNNPILDFFGEIEEKDLICESVTDWYAKYHDFCLSNNLQSVSRIEFSRQVKQHFKNIKIEPKRINGKVQRMFVL